MSEILDIRKYKGVLFDLDGILIDRVWEQADYEVLKAHGIKIDYSLEKERQKFLRTCKEKNVFLAWAEYLIKKFNLKNTTASKVREQQLNFEQRHLRHTNYKVNAGKFLLYVKSLGLKIGLVTQSNKDRFNIVCNENETIKMNAVFDTIITSDLIKNRKPVPDGYLQALKNLGLRASDVIVFEDNFVGATSAKNAGCDVCIMHDNQADEDREKLEKITPYHIKSFLEIVENDSIFANHEIAFDLLHKGVKKVFENDFVTAKEILNNSIELYRDLIPRQKVKKFDYNLEFQLGTALDQLGYAERELCELQNAILHGKEALAIREKESKGDDNNVASVLSNLAETYFKNGDFDLAFETYDKCYKMRKNLLKTKFDLIMPIFCNTCVNIAHLYKEQDKKDIALKYLLEAKQVYESHPHKENWGKYTKERYEKLLETLRKEYQQ
jgi:HAD superfamily hydrolase (TIGR01509 family)